MLVMFTVPNEFLCFIGVRMESIHTSFRVKLKAKTVVKLVKQIKNDNLYFRFIILI